MTQVGIVKEIRKQTVVISVVRKGACGDHCSMCGMCGASSIEVEADCSISVLPGDRVEICSEDRPVLLGLLCVFILPILLPLLSYVIFSSLLGTVGGVLSAAAVLLFCLYLIYRLNKSQKYLRASRCRVNRKVDE